MASVVEFSESRSLEPHLYEKLEERLLQALCDYPRNLFIRHLVLKSETAGLLRRVIAVKVEDCVLSQFSRSTDL
jgi:hypothetical protein